MVKVKLSGYPLDKSRGKGNQPLNHVCRKIAARSDMQVGWVVKKQVQILLISPLSYFFILTIRNLSLPSP